MRVQFLSNKFTSYSCLGQVSQNLFLRPVMYMLIHPNGVPYSLHEAYRKVPVLTANSGCLFFPKLT